MSIYRRIKLLEFFLSVSINETWPHKSGDSFMINVISWISVQKHRVHEYEHVVTRFEHFP
jgi:hypothetical protein